jgi:thioredoxin-related protein
MQKVAYAALLFLVLSLTLASSYPTLTDPPTDKITWHSWEDAIQEVEQSPKKVFIDLYTDWCGWCKKMDASTFTDPEVVAFMNEHFIAVKFNAEQRETVQYKGYDMKYRADAGRRGAHELAISLLNGKLGYPSFVYLDEEQNRITISPGYKEPAALLRELKYIAGEHYIDTKYQDFKGE